MTFDLSLVTCDERASERALSRLCCAVLVRDRRLCPAFSSFPLLILLLLAALGLGLGLGLGRETQVIDRSRGGACKREREVGMR